MDILKMAAIGVAAALLGALFKRERAELALVLSLGAGVLILLLASQYLRDILQELQGLADRAGLSSSTRKVLLKLLLTSYVTQFASELCKDAGAGAVAARIETGGKLVLVSLSLPIFTAMLELIEELV